MLSISGALKVLGGSAFAAFVLGYVGVIKKLRFYARLLVYVLDVAVVGFYGFVVSVALSVIGKQNISQWATARAFKFVCRYTLGLEVVVKNNGLVGSSGKTPEQVRPVIFLSNHQTEVDVCVLGTLFPKYCSVTAKKALKYYPFLGWYMACSGTIFIDRANRASGVKTLESAAKDMRVRKQSVFMFPEGTRSYYQEPGMLPLKKGAFHLAVQAQVPIVPCVVSNYSKFVNFKKRIFEPGTIEIEFLDMIPTEGMTDADIPALYEKASEIMKKGVIDAGYGSKYN